MITHIGDISTSQLKQDYLKIDNLSQFLFNIEQIHPLNEVKYLSYWKNIKKLVSEGMWGYEFNKYRYAPSSFIFYANFGLIQITDENKQTSYIRPRVDDLEWHLFYGLLEAEGFSGFYNDPNKTSDNLIFKYDKNKTPVTFRELQLFKANGQFKDYISPKESLFMLHDAPYGPPLFMNEAQNFSILGSRGGGKSYIISLGKLLHGIITDGGRFYNNGKYYKLPSYRPQDIMSGDNAPLIEVIIGSGDTNKSSEFVSKIQQNMNALATRAEFGVWGEPGDADYMPCPLYKDMSGSLAPNNKKNPWIHSYEVISKGRSTFEGSKSKLYHVSYSDQKAKGKGAQEGAGGRTKYSVVEESGLTGNTIAIHNSNKHAVSRDGIQFGVQIDLGTSGNLEMITQTKKKFLNPQDYNIVSFPEVWEGTGKNGKTAFFLPFYMTMRQYKDENGNTDYQKCFSEVKDIRDKAALSDDPAVLRDEKMNRPIVPSEMWITNKGYYLPYEQAIQVEKRLLKGNQYKKVGVAVKLSWSPVTKQGVDYTIDHKAEPFYELHGSIKNRMSLDGAIMIYDFPSSSITNDMCFATHDPYVSENIDEGGSLGVTHVWLNPKYWHTHMPSTGPLLASYIGKDKKGLKGYYEKQELLLAFYGNPTQGLYYEKNKGRACREHYIKRKKAYLLAPTPIKTTSASIQERVIPEYGIVVGNKLAKIQMLDSANDWLLAPITVNGVETPLINTLSCMFTIREIIGYDIEGNFDAVSSLILAPVAISEMEYYAMKTRKTKDYVNPLKSLSMNTSLFKDVAYYNRNNRNDKKERTFF